MTDLPQSFFDITEFVSEGLARDVVLLNVVGLSDYADYFLIGTGETAQHLEYLADRIVRKLRKEGVNLSHREGRGNSGWVLLDFNDLIVHLFTDAQRERYALEELWGAAKEVVRFS